MPDLPPLDAAALAQRLAALRQRHPGCDLEVVAEVVRAVLAATRSEPGPSPAGLLGEVEELGRTIAAARAEIAALQVDDITLNHIPSATDELDAIVAHTAGATENILEVCETLDRLAAAEGGETAATLQEATTRIYEACSFQDITGQRIGKVVAALKAIDAKVAQIIATFGGQATHRPAQHERPPPGDVLLHGPQLPANAMLQSDIDALLASFD